MVQNNKVIIDFREKTSGIPDLLMMKGMDVVLRELKTGDYFINNQILVERKTKEDFVQSLVSIRLFNQCQRMKKTCEHPLIIIEGDPYKTEHKINPQAIKGTLISISVAWQIPVLITTDKSETAEIIFMASMQMNHEKLPEIRKGYKPKKNRNKKLYFIQGLPSVGPVLATRLLNEFKSIERIMNTPESEFCNIEGIGKEKAKRIIDFIKK